LIRAVLFDLGGTLLDFNPQRRPWLEWERAGLEHAHTYLLARGYHLPLDAFIAHCVDSLPARWERATQGGPNLRLGDVLCEACAACGVAPAADEIDEAIARYVAPLDAQIEAYADALDTLVALRGRGLAMGLVSNTMWPGEYHRRELERFGLRPYLDHCVFSADVGLWKPQPGVYHLCLDALGVPAHQAVFVGDRPEHDVLGAQRAGMRGIHKRNGGPRSQDVRPDAEIENLAELPGVIERLLDGQPVC
jgi:putative hydrolase of the HAD superfamily